jgi:hypothetical protein
LPATELRTRIAEHVESITLVNTHDHLTREDYRAADPVDLLSLWFLHYASCDLVSAGMSPQQLAEIRDIKRPLDRRWKTFEPFWDRIRNTAYAKALLLAARDLYGVEDINRRTYRALSEQIAAANRKGRYAEVYRRAGIEVAIWDVLDPRPENVDTTIFAPTIRPDGFIGARSGGEVAQLARLAGVDIHNFDDFVRALDTYIDAHAPTIYAIKIGVAYWRPLRFERAARGEAESVFERMMADLSQGISMAEARPLQDFVMHHIVRRSIDHGLPIQVHTGIQEGNGNLITNSDSTLMSNLFLEYPQARFDLFHGSYPYWRELGLLAKVFPNVFADLCWVPTISPGLLRTALEEWIELVPSNKVSAFGADYLFVDGSYAASRMARRAVTDALCNKIEEGYLDEEEAAKLATGYLRENAWALFGLDRWRRRQRKRPARAKARGK